ncbi:VWA domain-containing protein [Humitalea sp. 24SJ18S-53]|uniref:VWA domain-containing protein n=1 Tax=Humitalea sp. 24SJ18S-53 TaxID=3422307 RepID=UPI003D67E4B5
MADTPAKRTDPAVAAFLAKVAAMPAVRTAGTPGRLIFALDATASRQHSWDQACHLQAQMFHAAAEVGSLAVSLCYFRGFMEFAGTPFLTDPDDMTRRMTGVRCLGGQTQILRVLRHAMAETTKTRVNALVFVGDAVEEDVDALCHAAGELGLRGTPVFVFHEGGHPIAANAFRQIARVSGGAYAPFDAGSAGALRDLLRAVAVFAAGGRRALAALAGPAAARIAGQLPAPAR